MPLVSPQEGLANDIKTILAAYDWETQFRINVGSGTKSINPKVFLHYEVAGKNVADNSIVLQPMIMRGIAANGPKARIGCSCNCFSLSPEIAFKLTEQVWNAIFANTDDQGVLWYVSGELVTTRQFALISTRTQPPTKQESGYWMAVAYVEAETQKSNTN